MPKLDQRGIINLLIPLILVLGIIVGVWLITNGNPLKIFSHASNSPIVFKSSTGQALSIDSSGVPQSSSPSVKIEFTSTLGGPAGISSPVSGPTQSTTKYVRYAEDPTSLNSATYQVYTKEPIVVDYTFSSAGSKFIWADFVSTDGRTDRKSGQINIISQTQSGPVKDSFNRGDNPEKLGQADTGQNWLVLRGKFGTFNNEAYPAAGCPAPGYVVVDGGQTDGVLQVTLSRNIPDARIPFRVKDLNNNYFLERDGSGYHLEKTVNGSRVLLIAKGAIPLKNGDVVRIELLGSNIKVFINDAKLFDINDSSNSGTQYGMGTWCDTSMRFDNFSFSPSASVTPTPTSSIVPSPTSSGNPDADLQNRVSQLEKQVQATQQQQSSLQDEINKILNWLKSVTPFK